MPEIDPRYIARLERRIGQLEAQEARLLNEGRRESLPGSFVTGRSGQSSAYSRKLDRQLDRTIDNAVKLRQVTQDLAGYRLRLERYRAGLVHRNGRPVKVEAPKTAKVAVPIATAEQVKAMFPEAVTISRTRWSKTHTDYRGYVEHDGLRVPFMMLPASEGGYGPVVIVADEK